MNVCRCCVQRPPGSGQIIRALKFDAADLLGRLTSCLIDTSSLDPRLIGVAISFHSA